MDFMLKWPTPYNYVVYVNKLSKNGTFRESLNVFGWDYSSAKKYFTRRAMEFSRLAWEHPDYNVVDSTPSKCSRCIKLFDGDKLVMHLEIALAKNLSTPINGLQSKKK